MKKKTPFWETKNPKKTSKKLTPAQIKAAKLELKQQDDLIQTW
jgi:hypothetical protein